MKLYEIKSIFSSKKQKIPIKNPIPSFAITGASKRPYIEPSFEKVLYETERPTILLISAVGATGKTALAQHLSKETQLPILDLGQHKPVGDNTLTGLLTTAYEVSSLGAVFEGLANGQYGIIIDGLDEGRSKTTAKAFEAFLDDLIKLCKTSSATTFIILGRTQALDDCWSYLHDHGVKTALVTISPFDISAAKKYIDTFSEGISSAFAAQYEDARDYILKQLGKVFSSSTEKDQFLSFIGYPPVLDAIVTLLTQERNYHRLKTKLDKDDLPDIEINLLRKIGEYVLIREKDEKIVPQIVKPLVSETPEDISGPSISNSYSLEEQSARIISYCLGRPISISVIPVVSLNEKYEESLNTFLPEHPFLKGHNFQNTVFEAMALAILIDSENKYFHQLVTEYVSSHKHTYHLIYLLDAISSDRYVSLEHVSVLLSSAMEFRSVHSNVEVHVNGPGPDEISNSQGEIDIEIEVMLGNERLKSFNFFTRIKENCVLDLGSRLDSVFVAVPCDVMLGNGIEIEFTAPVEIMAHVLNCDARTLILKTSKGALREVILEAQRLESKIETVLTNDSSLHLTIGNISDVTYPLIQFAGDLTRPPEDPLLRHKYFRLRRILMEFRSHSRGSMAKYRHKIEHDRVLKNAIGREILDKLVLDGVLKLKGEFYHLDTAALTDLIGVSWHNLRRGQIPDTLIRYLNTVVIK